ncbi:hypothetical protein MMC18_007562, partial [Xylographa bjoerkii]|nr:hypothetical protein [Xylographa bjoerkii]
EQLPLSWRGRAGEEGEMSFGQQCVGYISFLGDDRIEGKIEGMYEGECFFEGAKRLGHAMGGRHGRSAASMRLEWDGYNGDAYERENRARWDRSAKYKRNDHSAEGMGDLQMLYHETKMADPLSISVSIIAVLGAAQRVISVCKNYSSAVNDASWALPRVTAETRVLRNTLEDLESLVNRAAASSVNQSANSHSYLHSLEGPQDLCLAELQALERDLLPHDWKIFNGKNMRAALQAMSWSLKEADTKMLSTIQNTVQAVVDTTTGLHIDTRREKIHKWLSAPDPSINYNAALTKRQASTGSWFTGSPQCDKWKRTPGSLLWLHGIPGCGKTVLASTLIEDVLKFSQYTPSSTVACFYFDFNDSEKQQHEKMPRSLITQLTMQTSTTHEPLWSLYFGCNDGKLQPTVEALLVTLCKMAEKFEDVFLVFDALDECKDLDELIDDMKNFAGWKGDIRDELKALVNDDDIISIQSKLVTEDIRLYVRERLTTDRKLKIWTKKPDLLLYIEDSLMEKADGMFRWVACQLDELRTCLSPFEIKQTLAALPTTLDGTYARILCSISDACRPQVFKILQWLAYSCRPLRLEEISEIVAIDVNDNPRFNTETRPLKPQNVLAMCSSLVTTTAATDLIQNTAGEEARLAHLSVEEYLVSERIRYGPASEYNMQEWCANASIAEACLAYLLQFDERVCLTSENLSEFPLAEYAAKNWVEHTRQSGEGSNEMQELIMELLRNQCKKEAYKYWIRLCRASRYLHTSPYDRSLGKSELEIQDQDSEEFVSPLYYASVEGLTKTVRLLLETACNVNKLEGPRGSALHAASAQGHVQIVQLLLGKGADPNLRVQDGLSALMIATLHRQIEVVRLVLAIEGVDPELPNHSIYSPLEMAAIIGNVDIVKLLFEKSFDAEGENKEAHAALKYAIINRHVEVVKFLLAGGIDIALEDLQPLGDPVPQQLAGVVKNPIIAKLLIEAKAARNANVKPLKETDGNASIQDNSTFSEATDSL